MSDWHWYASLATAAAALGGARYAYTVIPEGHVGLKYRFTFHLSSMC
jgi:hypothetical protein